MGVLKQKMEFGLLNLLESKEVGAKELARLRKRIKEEK